MFRVDGEDTSGEGFFHEGLICPVHAYCLGALLGGNPVTSSPPSAASLEHPRRGPGGRFGGSSRDGRAGGLSRIMASRRPVPARSKRSAGKAGRARKRALRRFPTRPPA